MNISKAFRKEYCGVTIVRVHIVGHSEVAATSA